MASGQPYANRASGSRLESSMGSGAMNPSPSKTCPPCAAMRGRSARPARFRRHRRPEPAKLLPCGGAPATQIHSAGVNGLQQASGDWRVLPFSVLRTCPIRLAAFSPPGKTQALYRAGSIRGSSNSSIRSNLSCPLGFRNRDSGRERLIQNFQS